MGDKYTDFATLLKATIPNEAEGADGDPAKAVFLVAQLAADIACSLDRIATALEQRG